MLSDLIRPTDPDAERALLAYVLSVTTRDKSIVESVQPEAFDNKLFSQAWLHARALHERGEAITPRSVLTEAGQSGNAHLGSVFESVTGYRVSPGEIGEAARRVVEMHRMRALLDGVASAYERAQYADDYSQAVHFVSEAIDGLEGASTPREVVSFADALNRWRETVTDDRAPSRVFPTPWPTMNNHLSGGLEAGRSYVVGGRPGDGKSLAGANLATHAAENGHSALIFSVEMGEHEVVSRIIASGARANYGQITNRMLDQGNFDKINAYAAQKATMPLRIVDRADITLDSVKAICRSVKREHGLDVVFVDYLQLLTPTDSQLARERQVANISRGLKIMSRELDCAVITACQLNRNTSNESRPPRLSDLRESGTIEQDADVVILLNRTGAGGENMDGDIELIVAKNRTGPKGNVMQKWAAHQAAIR